MLTLLSELRFWSTKEDILVKDTDLGAVKYFEKKSENAKSIYSEGKRQYFESRGCKWNVDNKKPNRLRNALKLLEEELKQRRVVFCKWRNNVILQLMLSNGLLIHIFINPFNGDINRIYFDKYFIGKLISEQITDVIITQSHILISYNENQITFVHLQKPTSRKNNLEKITLMDPKIYNVIIGGPTTRKIPKHLVCSSSQEMVIVWTKSSQNEVYPWRPTVKDQDRANLHVYKLNGAKMELLCYYWTEYDPISVDFSLMNGFQVHSVEQKISKKGDVTIDSCIYQIHKTKMRRVAVTSIPLQTQVCCNAFSPDHEKLMLGCIDGSVVLFDEGRGITHLVKAAFIPTFISWHSDSSVVMIANEKGQLQCFDIALSCVRTQLMSEDVVPSSILDLSNYFAHPSNLAKLCWSKKPEITEHFEKNAITDCFLLLAFENGPLGCVRFVGGTGLKGDVHTSGLTADVLIHKYISLNQVEKAINILLSLNWDTYGAMCLLSLHRIANYIFKQPLGTERELQLQKALGSFLVPVKPLCYETEVEFGDQVNDITLRFFHYLLRNKSYNKAFSLAIDINDADLFLKLHDKAKTDGDVELAKEALKKVDVINRICTDRSDSEHSLCSNSSCSLCAESFDEDDDDDEDDDGSERESSQLQMPRAAKISSTDAVSFKSYSTSSSSSKSSQIRNGALKHPPLPKTTTEAASSSIATRTATANVRPKSEFSNDRPPLPYVPKKAPTTTMQRSQTAMALKLSKQQQSRIAQTRLRGKSLSSSNLLSVSDNTSPYFGTSIQRGNVRARLNPREKAAKLYASPASSLSMEQLDISNRSSRPFYVDFVDNPAASRPPPNGQHVVIDVVPKPIGSPNALKYPPTNILDQTIGIPLVQDEPDFARRPRKPWFTSQAPQPQFRSIPNPSNVNNAPRTVIHQYPLISGNIPSKFQSSSKFNQQPPEVVDRLRMPRRKEPAASILSNSTNSSLAMAGPSSAGFPQPGSSSASSSSAKKESGEKNKVKFSDTVTVAVVPEIPRKDKLGEKSRKPPYSSMIADPKRELAESLPLCHPNDDYLKDFTPMQEIMSNSSDQHQHQQQQQQHHHHQQLENADNENNKKIPNIKVVHFGVV